MSGFYKTRRKEKYLLYFLKLLTNLKKVLNQRKPQKNEEKRLCKTRNCSSFLFFFSFFLLLCNSSAERKFLHYVIYFEILSPVFLAAFWRLEKLCVCFQLSLRLASCEKMASCFSNTQTQLLPICSC